MKYFLTINGLARNVASLMGISLVVKMLINWINCLNYEVLTATTARSA
jgi:hypothetical protein